MLTKCLLIFLAGGVGSVARFLLSNWGQRQTSGNFPVGTLLVNILGCFAIGLLAALFANRFPIREEYRLMLTTGLLGGFTTFSAFALETNTLLQNGQQIQAVVYVGLSLLLGLIAVLLGQCLAQLGAH